MRASSTPDSTSPSSPPSGDVRTGAMGPLARAVIAALAWFTNTNEPDALRVSHLTGEARANRITHLLAQEAS